MRLERAVRFGFIGTIGVMAISLGTFWMLQHSDRPASPTGEFFIFLIVVTMGVAVVLMFLFALFDVFVDEKLDAREHNRPKD